MSDYKPNSHKYKTDKKTTQPERKIESVVSGKVKTKKKSEMSKFKNAFISEDVSNVKDYIFMDVLIPAIKKVVSDMVRDGVDMILYGDTKGSNSKSGKSSTYVSYREYSSRDRERGRSTRAKTGYTFDDISFEYRGDAEKVLDRMEEIIDTFDSVSVADLYDLVGMSCEYTDNNYGWTELCDRASVIRTRDGSYMLKLPRACRLD